MDQIKLKISMIDGLVSGAGNLSCSIFLGDQAVERECQKPPRTVWEELHRPAVELVVLPMDGADTYTLTGEEALEKLDWR